MGNRFFILLTFQGCTGQSSKRDQYGTFHYYFTYNVLTSFDMRRLNYLPKLFEIISLFPHWKTFVYFGASSHD
jgi:hypothetical protein